jgi:cellulose synthase operon protein C
MSQQTRNALLHSAVALSLLSGSVVPAFAQPAGPAPSPTDGPRGVPVTDGSAGPTAGPSLGVPMPPPPVAPVVRVPLTAEDRNTLKDIEGEFNHFSDAGEKHQARMRDLMMNEYRERTRALEKKFADRMAKIDSDKAKRHTETVALLEKFIVEHPAHATFTPDAMFRLADLYLDAADDEVDSRAVTDTADPAAIIANYSKSVKLWEQILEKFPSYRQLPATLYLLAYYTKNENPRRSLTLFLSLTCGNKFKYTDPPQRELSKKEATERIDSKKLRDGYSDCQALPNSEAELVRHAWVRGIADYQFTVPGELDDAIAAYTKVANGVSESPLYAESLYKLAWSYYRRDFLFESIKKFDESVKLYDTLVAAGGTPTLELRDEAIQYISVAFTDPWEGESDTDPDKALQRAKDFYKGREAEPHVRDVWVAMGKAFSDLQAYDRSVDAYRIALGPPWELNPANPTVHQEIVNVFEAKGDKFAADNEAAALATRYAPGSAWYQANEKDREAMENQRRLAERALYAAARNTHKAATEGRQEWEKTAKKDPQEKEKFLALYDKAVELYQTFIKQYPESDYVYEFTYMQGEALFFSEHYLEAVVQYKWVRDHRDMSEQFFLAAAQSILQSYEAEAARQVAEGKITALKVPTGAELKALPQPMQAQPIPEIYQLLQNEWDTYQNVVPDPKTAPGQGINAALVSLAYLHIDDSIVRFQKVMDKFCGNNEAVKAKDALLSVYEATNQLDKFEATNKKFIATKCGDTKSIELAQSQNRSIEFKRASQLYADKQFILAAESFYRYYKTAPSTDTDLPIALYNAAVAFKLGDRPKTAISMFQEFTANKDKRFRESPFYLDAMRLTALSYQAAFEYDKAISTYLELYDTAKKAQKLGIKAPDPLPGEKPLSINQIALDSLFNAAFAAELNRDFKRAIDLYSRYEREESDRAKKDAAVWSVAGIYRSSGDATNMVEQLDKWRRVYGKDASNADRYVQSFYDTAALWKRKGKQTNAEKAGVETVDAWKLRGKAKASTSAKMAGEWALYFAEKFYDDTFVPYSITKAAKTVQELEAQKKDASAVLTKTQEKYLVMDEFSIAEYSMAAKVRYGESVYQYAQKLSNAPIPIPVQKNPNGIAAYEETRDKNLKKYLDEAKAQWMEVVELSKKAGISNRWSQLALENLGREFPGEFQVLRQELTEGTEAP